MGEEIQFAEALSYGASAPFIVMIIGQLKAYLDYPGRLNPLIALALAAAWGAVLVSSDYLNVDTATFVLQAFTVATSAIGIHGAFRTYEPEQEDDEEDAPKRPVIRRPRKPPSLGKVG